jgi:hypothetical protein
MHCMPHSISHAHVDGTGRLPFRLSVANRISCPAAQGRNKVTMAPTDIHTVAYVLNSLDSAQEHSQYLFTISSLRIHVMRLHVCLVNTTSCWHPVRTLRVNLSSNVRFSQVQVSTPASLIICSLI